jgi:hypothetical protein
MNTEQIAYLEKITEELLQAFEVYAPPVPIEHMLREPVNQMWREMDLTQLSGSFLDVRDQYSPRMSLARLLVRHIARSEWGQQRHLAQLLDDEDNVRRFSRMLIMPRAMIDSLTTSTRTALAISQEFEVPVDEAKQRLTELMN